jgi:4-amino-4-deoxy-L-arabinose transferase-like glycosyltransferase
MPARRRRLAALPLVAIVLIAGGLRFWAIDFGRPHPLVRPDEKEILQPSFRFAQGDLNPRYHVYPGLYLYLVWLWGEAGLALRRLEIPTPPYPMTLLRDLQGLPGGANGATLVFGRALSAVGGTASAVVVYALARRREGLAVAAVAGALVATCYLHVRDSHVCKPDVLLGLFILPALAACARVMRTPTAAAGAWAGFWIGVATGMKQPGILVLIPLYVANILGSRASGWRRWLPGAPVWAGAAVATTVFLVTSPFLILDAGFVWRQMSPSIDTVLAPTGTRQERALLYHITTSFRHGTGIVFELLAGPAIVMAALAREPLYRMAAVFALVWLAVIGGSPVHHVRYLTPLVPVLALLVAVLMGRIAARAGRRAPLALALATALVVWEPLGSSIAHDRILAETDTRVLANRWLAAHAHPGDVVDIVGTCIWPYGEPVMPPGVRSERLPATMRTLGGATWVLTHDHVLPFSHVDPEQWVALAPGLRLEAEFSPFLGTDHAGWFEQADAYYAPFRDFDGVVRPGPVIRIYSVRPADTRTGPSADASTPGTPSCTSATRST